MARSVLELLEDINSQGATIIMVTHDPELAARAQRNVHIVDGMATDLSVEPSLARAARETTVASSPLQERTWARPPLIRRRTWRRASPPTALPQKNTLPTTPRHDPLLPHPRPAPHPPPHGPHPPAGCG